MSQYTFEKEDGALGLIRCPKCLLENYCLCVFEGKCAWCGYSANLNEEKENE